VTYIARSEHVFIAGKTGSGKSYLAERYLVTEKHVVMLDTKGETLMRIEDKKPMWSGVKDEDIDLCLSLEDLNNVTKEKVIYVPDPREMNEESYNAFFKWIYDRKNTIVWIDELTSVCPSPMKMPLSLMDIYARGRSRKTTAWALTQRPVGVPGMCISQSSHVFGFSLNKESDRKRLVDDTGMTEFYERPPQYQFWYYKDGADNAVLARLVERG
jgi:hypothetical protein